MKKLTIYVSLIAFLVSCGSIRQAQIHDLNEKLLEDYWSNQVDAEYLSLKSRIEVTENGSTSQFTANIRMQKDSVIWASIGLLGLFEGVRALITPDSVHIMNRLEKTYMVRSTDYLKQIMGMDVELSEIQSIIIGNAPFSSELYQLITTDSTSVLMAQKGNIINLIGVNDNKRTYRSAFSSTQRTESGNFIYDVYKSFGGLKLPSEILGDIVINGKKSSVVIKYENAKNRCDH